VLDLSTAEFVGDELFATFRKKGHVRPDVVVKLGTRDGENQFAIFHAEMEGEFRNETEKRLKLYFHHLGIEYDDPPVITAVLFRSGGPVGIKKREVVRKVGSWISNRFYYLAFGLSGSLAEDWLKRPQSVVTALAAFMGSQIWDPVEKKLRCLEAISRTEPDEGRQFTLGEVVKAAVQLDEAETARFDQELEKREEVKKMLLTWDEALAESKAQGMALGKTEGMALGRV
ncbi:MAG: hypothetical protein GY856_40525, partial [bacterium]|nr:hypothetical protein [bacterium]